MLVDSFPVLSQHVDHYFWMLKAVVIVFHSPLIDTLLVKRLSNPIKG